MSFRPAAFALLIAAAACNRQATKPEAERFAILRFENLSGDGSADWMGRAFAEVIGSELTATRGVSAIQPEALMTGARQLGIVTVSAPGVSAGMEAAIAAGANRIGYGDYVVNGSTVRVRFWLENAQTHRYGRVVEVAGPVTDVIGLATGLAKSAVPASAGYPTASQTALQNYCNALESTNAGDAVAKLENAIAADGNFAPPYRVLAEVEAGTSKDKALATLDAALQHASAFPPAEKARIEGQAATLRGDTAGQQNALTQLAQQDPNNPNQWRALANLAMSRRDYAQAVDAFHHVLQLQPNDVSAMNELAYASAYSGDTAGALSALDKYRALQPKDPNAFDSRGDILLLTGQLKEAEAAYEQASKLDPNFQGGGDLYKAATAHLMTGDVAGADAIFGRYLAGRKATNDREADFKAANWMWLEGKQSEGIQAMTAFADAASKKQERAQEAQAEAQLSLWDLMRGNRADAAAMARKAAQAAGNLTLVAIAAFLSQPTASAEEWEARAEKSIHAPGQPGLSDSILAYALLLDGQVAAAAAPLGRARVALGVGSEEGMSVLLAWSDLEAGKKAEAAELLKHNPVPPMTGPAPMTGLYFPRLFALRAQAAADPKEAQTSREIFGKLSPRS